MPPKVAGATAAARKGSQFKPPRPVKAPAQASATTRAPTAAASRAAPAGKPKPSAARSGFQSANATIISSDDDQDDHVADDSDDIMDVDETPARAKPTPAESMAATQPIPAPLLARLLLENFEDPNTQIQKGAMNLTSRYIDIFVREALARAKHERARAAKNDGISDGFLQVEDLERLAPQLVLDF
jgi:hypothetical protein